MLKVLTKAFLSSILILSYFSNCSFSKKTIETNEELIGNVTIREIEGSKHKEWFNRELSTYQVDTETLDDFWNNPERLKTISIQVFMGSWCSDSQREVPRFYNIMRYLNVTNFEIIGMDYDKKTPGKLEKGKKIKYVPTFIIYQNEKEINRIVESPVQSLEKDLVAIIQAKNYTPHYN